MTDITRLHGPAALAAIREEPRLPVTTLDMDAVLTEDAAEVGYEASVIDHRVPGGSWYEYWREPAMLDRGGDWGVLVCQAGRYEPDTNVLNDRPLLLTWEPCPSRHIARAIATARNLGKPDPFPID